MKQQQLTKYTTKNWLPSLNWEVLQLSDTEYIIHKGDTTAVRHAVFQVTRTSANKLLRTQL